MQPIGRQWDQQACPLFVKITTKSSMPAWLGNARTKFPDKEGNRNTQTLTATLVCILDDPLHQLPIVRRALENQVKHEDAIDSDDDLDIFEQKQRKGKWQLNPDMKAFFGMGQDGDFVPDDAERSQVQRVSKAFEDKVCGASAGTGDPWTKALRPGAGGSGSGSGIRSGTKRVQTHGVDDSDNHDDDIEDYSEDSDWEERKRRKEQVKKDKIAAGRMARRESRGSPKQTAIDLEEDGAYDAAATPSYIQHGTRKSKRAASKPRVSYRDDGGHLDNHHRHMDVTDVDGGDWGGADAGARQQCTLTDVQQAKVIAQYPASSKAGGKSTPGPSSSSLDLTAGDAFRLQEGEFLNDVLVDFYLKWLVRSEQGAAASGGTAAPTRRGPTAARAAAEELVAAGRGGAHALAGTSDQTEAAHLPPSLPMSMSTPQPPLTDAERKRLHVFSSYFYTRLTEGKKKEVGGRVVLKEEDGYANVRRWTRDIDLFEKDLILVIDPPRLAAAR